MKAKMRLVMNVKSLLSLLALACLVAACEKPFVELDPEASRDDDANLVVRVVGFETLDFGSPSATKTTVPVTDLCSRLNFVVYSGETKVSSVAQKEGDDGFGTVALSLPEGTYRIAVVGHSSEGSATVTTLDKISFKNNRVTDTFSYYTEVEITDEAQTLDVELRRVVAMFRMALTEPLPEAVHQLKFYYTGGSSTLSAVTGYGSVNSKQTVVLDVDDGQTQFEVYTIPHAETGKLKMTITALDVSGSELHQRVFEEVPVQRNKITRYTGNFYEGTSAQNGGLEMQMHASPDWDGEEEHTF